MSATAVAELTAHLQQELCANLFVILASATELVTVKVVSRAQSDRSGKFRKGRQRRSKGDESHSMRFCSDIADHFVF